MVRHYQGRAEPSKPKLLDEKSQLTTLCGL
jgi:hypothetical protein